MDRIHLLYPDQLKTGCGRALEHVRDDIYSNGTWRHYQYLLWAVEDKERVTCLACLKIMRQQLYSRLMDRFNIAFYSEQEKLIQKMIHRGMIRWNVIDTKRYIDKDC